MVLTKLRRSITSRGDLGNVELHLARADALPAWEAGSFDVVILNSVVQYFPSIEYLLKVLTEAARMVTSDGHVFIGDVRSLPLLKAFRSEVEQVRAPNGVSERELQARAEEAVRIEEELVLDPRFFFALRHCLPRLTRVAVRLEAGPRFERADEVPLRRHIELRRARRSTDAAVARLGRRRVSSRRSRGPSCSSDPSMVRDARGPECPAARGS